jgi:hypothetical protein
MRNLGDAQFLNHAESEILFKSFKDAQKTGGTLPKELTIFVDRPTCNSCKDYLGGLMTEFGIEKINIYYKHQRNGFTYVSIVAK